jgi:hypothetical protein
MIRGDNNGSIAIMKNPQFHKRSKHIDLQYHLIQEHIQRGMLEPQYATHLNEKQLYLGGVRGSMLQMLACPVSFIILLSFIYRHYLIATCLFSMYWAAAPIIAHED